MSCWCRKSIKVDNKWKSIIFSTYHVLSMGSFHNFDIYTATCYSVVKRYICFKTNRFKGWAKKKPILTVSILYKTFNVFLTRNTTLSILKSINHREIIPAYQFSHRNSYLTIVHWIINKQANFFADIRCQVYLNRFCR